MTKNDKKLYDKAMDKFNDGEIDKALELSEQCIAEDLKNSAALNLKGLILYLQGKGQEAKTTWETNREYNDDDVAKSYLKSLENDIDKLGSYEKAIKRIEEFEINEGIEELEKLTDSDFNVINVCNALTYAYIKKGEFENALKYNKRVLEHDRSNKLAIDHYKEISTYYDVGDLNIKVKKNRNYKIIGGIVAVIIVGALGTYAITNMNKENTPNQNSYVSEDSNTEKETSEPEVKEEVKKLDVEAVKKAKDEKDYKKLSDEIKYIKIEGLNDDEAKLVKESKELLGREGVDEFYNEGRRLFKNKDYKKAEEELKYAYTNSEDSYLRPHIVYMLAANSEKADNSHEAILYYKEYVKDFADTDYAAECAYKVAVLSKDTDKVESEKYAKMVKDNYSGSMYNNSNIKEILGEE